jgi:hypothetical protein
MSTAPLDPETVARVKREALEELAQMLNLRAPAMVGIVRDEARKLYPPPPPKRVRAEVHTIAGTWALGSDADAWYWRSSVASSGALPCEIVAEMFALQARADDDGMVTEGEEEAAPEPAPYNEAQDLASWPTPSQQRPREWWANRYEKDPSFYVHTSRESADDGAKGGDRAECIHLREVLAEGDDVPAYALFRGNSVGYWRDKALAYKGIVGELSDILREPGVEICETARRLKASTARRITRTEARKAADAFWTAAIEHRRKHTEECFVIALEAIGFEVTP